MLQNALTQLLNQNKAALIYQNEVISARQLVARAISLFASLEDLQRNSKPIAFCMPNSPELLCYQLACFYLGIAIVPIIYECEVDDIQKMMALTQPAFLFTTTEKQKQFSEKNISLNFPSILIDETHLEIIAIDASHEMSLASSAVNPNNLAMIIFSSGTAGVLKGIMHTYQSAAGFIQTLIEILAVHPGLTYLVAQPMGHIGGIATTIMTLLYNGLAILMVNFEVNQYMQTMQSYQPTHINLHTPLFYQVINYPDIDKKAFSRIKTCFAGGDDTPIDLPKLFTEKTGAPMQIGYGMTEIGIVIVNFDPYHSHAGSSGKKIPSVHIELKNEKDRPVELNEIGEIWVKSPACCLGYWNMPERNAVTLVNGWFRTGDLARIDNESYYWYMGRTSEVIHSDGHVIYPQNIEQIIFNFPAVQSVAVVGMKNANGIEMPVAFVELKKEFTGESLQNNILKYAAQHLKMWQMPTNVIILDKLPLNLTGKIDRTRLAKTSLDFSPLPSQS